MKLTKSDLKAIVKECLVEILTEGLGSSLTAIKRNPLPRQENPYLDEKRAHAIKHDTSKFQEFIKKESGGNRIMEDIFTDTASSTLQKILQSEAKGAVPVKHNAIEQVVADANPEDLFGEEIISKWASYAFANNAIKK
jgi:hypothetical protein